MKAIKIDPSAWEFSHTEEQLRRVGEAYNAHLASFDTVPDVQVLMTQIMLGFGGSIAEIVRFWEQEFLSDLPTEYAEVKGAARSQLEDLWRKHKLQSIVGGLGLKPLVSWDVRTITASLKAPRQFLAAAQELCRLEDEDYGLVSIEPDDLEGDAVVTWHLRKQREEKAP